MFQIRLHFVLEERIGIEETGAEQLLTRDVDRAREWQVIATRARSLRQMQHRWRVSAFASDSGNRDLFCIRLHFVLEERIGVEKISAQRFLTIDEVARRGCIGAR
ncbi:hypothetical protein N2603_23620 [Bradyrhizobium huanghuaihaiense]|uniref:hypothetical protein n=1 Tax=Bradyrhizobium huanghuaihaiense TaxID=990078 RepID=UPI0021AAD921|nr:hypothetical protein [Bradyrhizobium sp. CB3035]UWU73095.1 hypothetical protein N2603_23620 [Bradyrhizobium sp. CB3035]